MRRIDVTAAIIERDNKYLIAKRKEGKHLENKWEFPGGKIDAGETPEACLARELKEEFGAVVHVGSFFCESIFDYGEKSIRLLAYRTTYLSGEFQLRDHSEIKWVLKDELIDYDFADADIPIVKKLAAKV